jgi:hypothetical protein
MAEITINFPMEEESVSINVGDKLTINFTEDCHPCWAPEDAGLFDHPLPHHDHQKGYQWTGTAIKSGTLDCSYVPCGEKCDKKVGGQDGGHSIKVGD